MEWKALLLVAVLVLALAAPAASQPVGVGRGDADADGGGRWKRSLSSMISGSITTVLSAVKDVFNDTVKDLLPDDGGGAASAGPSAAALLLSVAMALHYRPL